MAAIIFRIYLLEKVMSLGNILNAMIFSSDNHLIKGTQYIFNGSFVEKGIIAPIIRCILQIICFYLF